MDTLRLLLTLTLTPTLTLSLTQAATHSLISLFTVTQPLLLPTTLSRNCHNSCSSAPVDRDPVADFMTERIRGARFFELDAICDRSSPLPHMLPTEVCVPLTCAAAVTCAAQVLSTAGHISLRSAQTGSMPLNRGCWTQN